jgi:hypothetical protein
MGDLRFAGLHLNHATIETAVKEHERKRPAQSLAPGVLHRVPG